MQYVLLAVGFVIGWSIWRILGFPSHWRLVLPLLICTSLAHGQAVTCNITICANSAWGGGDGSTANVYEDERYYPALEPASRKTHVLVAWYQPIWSTGASQIPMSWFEVDPGGGYYLASLQLYRNGDFAYPIGKIYVQLWFDLISAEPRVLIWDDFSELEAVELVRSSTGTSTAIYRRRVTDDQVCQQLVGDQDTTGTVVGYISFSGLTGPPATQPSTQPADNEPLATTQPADVRRLTTQPTTQESWAGRTRQKMDNAIGSWGTGSTWLNQQLSDSVFAPLLTLYQGLTTPSGTPSDDVEIVLGDLTVFDAEWAGPYQTTVAGWFTPNGQSIFGVVFDDLDSLIFWDYAIVIWIKDIWIAFIVICTLWGAFRMILRPFRIEVES